MIEVLWFLLPVAAASGWCAARRSRMPAADICTSRDEYFRGLNYLLNDKPDEALDVFARIAREERDHADTHLTLGTLFRRRGEVDRAIRIHGGLLSRQSLSQQQRGRATLELADDFLRAGLFDRAEEHFLTLASQDQFAEVALCRLIGIYQQQKDWRQAIECCDRLEGLTGKSRQVEAAQYCCELAAQALAEGRADAARESMREALHRDPRCARASLLQARLAMEAQDWKRAIPALQAVEFQCRSYVPEALDALERCFDALDRRHDLIDYLAAVQERGHSGHVSVRMANLIRAQYGADGALDFLESDLQAHPTVMGLALFFELMQAHECHRDLRAELHAVYRVGRDLLDCNARYRCESCGFVARGLHWQCPTCRDWNSVRPVPDALVKSAV